MANWFDETQAERYNLSPAALKILFSVSAWFNGKAFIIDEKRYSIDTAHEPPLRQLCLAGDLWSDSSADVADSLRERGFFKSEARDERVYIAGRRCNWLPTQGGLEVIEKVLYPAEQLVPQWREEEHQNPPLYRDGTELMAHRKAVLAAAANFDGLGWVTNVEYYPRVDLPVRPDLRIWGTEAHAKAYVEALSLHNDRDSWVQKFRAWDHPTNPPVLWIFENRRHMVQFWNHLIRSGELQLAGGMFQGEPNNWPPERVNDRLKRTRNGPGAYDSIDLCWTTAGLIQGGRYRLHEFSDEYGIFD